MVYARPLAARKKLKLELEIEHRPAGPHVDPEKIERVLVNLVSNALKFTREGRVTVALRGVRRRGALRCRGHRHRHRARGLPTSSNGSARGTARSPGVSGNRHRAGLRQGDRGAARRAASRWRARPARAAASWSTCRGGRAVPERRVTGGWAAAPEAPAEAEEDQEPREWAQRLQRQNEYRFAEIEQVTDRRLVPPGGRPPARRAILVVEDNPEILELINLQLRDQYTVYVAQNGRQGLELARRERPDLIVTDYMMPEMDGLTMLRALRAGSELAETPGHHVDRQGSS